MWEWLVMMVAFSWTILYCELISYFLLVHVYAFCFLFFHSDSWSLYMRICTAPYMHSCTVLIHQGEIDLLTFAIKRLICFIWLTNCSYALIYIPLNSTILRDNLFWIFLSNVSFELFWECIFVVRIANSKVETLCKCFPNLCSFLCNSS